MAALILSSFGTAALAPSNPYLHSATQVGTILFAAAQQLDLVTRVVNPAYRAAWWQKWLVHRRLRPEAFGGRIHNHVTGAAKYPIHSDVLNSAALKTVFSAKGSYLLPQAYPLGSPLHPSYPASHPEVAGAGITILKALFNESFVIPSPVTPSDDGLSLAPYTGASLTVGGELNKLASNIALGRDAAGVHYRSDGMTAKPLAFLLADLGVTKTHSRPHTSDDNPFSESHFKTLKYRPDFPDRFGCQEDARSFCQQFFTWYNTEHHHSGLGLLTPDVVHHQCAEQVRNSRQITLTAAYAAHPERFVLKPPQPPALPRQVWINPPPQSESGPSGSEKEAQ